MKSRAHVPLRLLACLVAVVMLAAVAAGCGDSDSGSTSDTAGDTGGGSSGKKFKIGFVTPGADAEFWQTIAKGADEAAAKYDDIEVIKATGPDSTKFEQMIPEIESLMTRGVDALVVPGGPQLLPVLKRAAAENIPVVLTATGLPEFPDAVTTVITDNLKGGQQAGEYMVKKLGGKGEVAILDIARGTYPLLDLRADGVKKAFEGTDIKVVAQINTNCETAKAVSVSENILTSHPNLAGFFGACGAAILGAEQALKGADAVTVGYDALVPEVKNVQAGKQDATVAQFPADIGRSGVEAARKSLLGEEVPKEILAPTELVTKENAEEFLQ